MTEDTKPSGGDARNPCDEREVSGEVINIDDKAVMALWRKAGLPEWLLGNCGSNQGLVKFAKLCALENSDTLQAIEEAVIALKYTETNDSVFVTGFNDAIDACLNIIRKERNGG